MPMNVADLIWDTAEVTSSMRRGGGHADVVHIYILNLVAVSTNIVGSWWFLMVHDNKRIQNIRYSLGIQEDSTQLGIQMFTELSYVEFPRHVATMHRPVHSSLSERKIWSWQDHSAWLERSKKLCTVFVLTPFWQK
jgi:hypothetical protein